MLWGCPGSCPAQVKPQDSCTCYSDWEHLFPAGRSLSALNQWRWERVQSTAFGARLPLPGFAWYRQETGHRASFPDLAS